MILIGVMSAGLAAYNFWQYGETNNVVNAIAGSLWGVAAALNFAMGDN